MEIQVVCRVTDPQVLLGGVEKVFDNHVTLFTSDREQIGSDSESVTIQKQTLSKTGTYNEEVNGGRYPFQITLNELGEDLVKGSNTITLVDELSDTLTLDVASIKVVKTGTDEVIEPTISVVGQTLEITLPDNLPLTITYETTVKAAPGQAVNISNKAYWKGYTAPDGGSVKKENFSYAAGGTVGGSATPTVTIEKRDQYDATKLLPGATFQLMEMTCTESGDLIKKDGGLTLQGITGDDGTLTFGADSNNLMTFNTIYCLMETKAPDGYVLDDTPHYFAVAKLENGTYPAFPDGVTIWYNSSKYTYHALNHKGEATVTKKFLGENDEELKGINGTYRFGIYDNVDATGEPLQTVSITYAKNTVNPEGGTAKFTNLELGKTYYVYELNDSDEPITTLGGTVSGKPFLVSYAGNAVTVTEDAVANVTVTNKVNYPELPLTGGRGTTCFYFLGSLLALAAGMLLVTRKRVGRSQ